MSNYSELCNAALGLSGSATFSHFLSHNFAIQAQATVGSLASAHIVLQLSDSTALNSSTRLKLIIFSDGASPVPVLSYLPVLAKRVKYAF